MPVVIFKHRQYNTSYLKFQLLRGIQLVLFKINLSYLMQYPAKYGEILPDVVPELLFRNRLSNLQERYLRQFSFQAFNFLTLIRTT